MTVKALRKRSLMLSTLRYLRGIWTPQCRIGFEISTVRERERERERDDDKKRGEVLDKGVGERQVLSSLQDQFILHHFTPLYVLDYIAIKNNEIILIILQ